MAKGMTFSEKMREASRNEHSVSDSLVAARLILATTDMRLWAQALSAFWHIHSSIEDALDKAECPELRLLKDFLPRVRRKAAFEEDLKTFYGAEYIRRSGKISPEVETYLHRLSTISETSPHLLIAHAYTQHMAMLAGGQAMRTSVRRALQIAPQDPGTATFEFKEPAKGLRTEYKALIDKLEGKLGEKKAQEVIEEHRLVFRLNNDIIRTFPVSVSRSVKGIIKLIPVEILLLLISLLFAFALMYVTRTWILLDPDADLFEDPDFVQH